MCGGREAAAARVTARVCCVGRPRSRRSSNFCCVWMSLRAKTPFPRRILHSENRLLRHFCHASRGFPHTKQEWRRHWSNYYNIIGLLCPSRSSTQATTSRGRGGVLRESGGGGGPPRCVTVAKRGNVFHESGGGGSFTLRYSGEVRKGLPREWSREVIHACLCGD